MVVGGGGGSELQWRGVGSALVSCLRGALLALVVLVLLGLGAAHAGAALPDGRGYELVSPPLKNGGEIMPDSQRTRAAAGGLAVGFASLAGFGDARSLGVSTDYIGVRTGAAGTNGWAVHGISPPQDPMVFAADEKFMEPLYWGEFSSDLSSGVFRSWSPVTDAPMVANQQNLYVRHDLLTAGSGAFELLTDCPACSSPLAGVADPTLLAEQSFPAGASQDFGHVIFESRLPLTGDSTANPDTPVWNLFEWDHGTVRLAGVLPDSACGSPPCAAPASQAGMGAKDALYTPHAISTDGSRIFFTVPGTCASAFPGCGDLYLRSDHASTVQLNASERTVPDPGGHRSAQYWDASADGSRAFFLSVEALTDDAPVNGNRKLYMYSVEPDAQGHHLTFLSVDQQPADDATASDDVAGVIGASDDGHTVYFVDRGGQLAPGAPTGSFGVSYKVFRWHDGTIDYVGAIPDDGEAQDVVNDNINFLAIPKQARVSSDGRFLLFSAEKGTGLTGYNHGSCPGNGTPTGTCRELYLYRADASPHLVCVSCNPSGAKGTADASDVVHSSTGAAAVTYHLNRALSDDGSRVFFSTAEALVPEDVNGAVDAYEYDVAANRLHLLSTGTDTSNSYFMDASPSGDDVFILTRQRLSGWDIDNGYDLYDVRVGGGVPEPVGQVVCGADTCRGAVTAAPGVSVADSESTVGSQVKPAVHRRPVKPRCRRGFVRKRVRGRVRCVKAPKHSKRKARGAARARSGR